MKLMLDPKRDLAGATLGPAGSGAVVVIAGASAEAPNGDARPATSVSGLSRDRLPVRGHRAASPATRLPNSRRGGLAKENLR